MNEIINSRPTGSPAAVVARVVVVGLSSCAQFRVDGTASIIVIVCV